MSTPSIVEIVNLDLRRDADREKMLDHLCDLANIYGPKSLAKIILSIMVNREAADEVRE